MNTLLVSLKFNVGHLSELMGWAEAVAKTGNNPSFLLADEYSYYYQECRYKITYMKDGLNNLDDFSSLIICNLSKDDIRIIKLLKKTHSFKYAFVYHEPWRGFNASLHVFHKSIKGFIKQLGRNIFSYQLIKHADLVLFPSEEAMSIYEHNQIGLNKRYCFFPLIFPDESNGRINKDKRFFSYIATASYSRSIDVFFDFIKYAAPIEKNMRFQIVTKSDIDRYLDDCINSYIQSGRLIVKQKKPLSVDEINAAYNDSIATWLMYRSSSQSGVIIKSFMWGSPCIATRAGVFAAQIDNKNGILVDDVNDFDGILNAYRKIVNEPEKYIDNARSSFFEYYSADKWYLQLEEIIDKYLS